MNHWKLEALHYDFVVCGGGLAGVCAAIAAARQGVRVGLLHDRTVLGGNSSSEVRVTPHGAAQHHPYGRETGIIGELIIEERAVNHAEIFENGWTNSVWDLVLLTAVMAEPTIDLHLNTKVINAERTGSRITSVEALVLDSETRITATAPLFLDATGDGLVAHAAGCRFMTGSEGRDVFGEPEARPDTNNDTMGNSLMFKTEEVGPTPQWKPPFWAHELRDRSFFYDAGRIPNDPRGGFWWVELGMPRHTIYDNRSIRTDLQRYILGIWDWMKNADPETREGCATRALDWIGSVLGTRESRRVVGPTIVTEGDIQTRRPWPDEVAYGGWFLDLHTPGGLIAEHSEENSATRYNPFTEKAARGFVGPYGIPLSCLMAEDVENLFLAGRDISASHVALGTMRVMGTTALMGQAVGTAAARVLADAQPADRPNGASSAPTTRLTPDQVHRVQQQLLRDGMWLPNTSTNDPADHAPRATITTSSQDAFTKVVPGQTGWAEDHDLLDLRIDREFLARTDTRMAQLLATDGTLEQVSICLTNHGATATTAELAIRLCNGIHDYTVYPREHALAHHTATVAPGGSSTPGTGEPAAQQWITWELPQVAREAITAAATPESPVYVRLELAPNPALQWHQGRTCYPGHPALYEVALGKMRRLQHGVTLACEVHPPQRVYGPRSVVSGVTRPAAAPHQWRSDPATALPAWCTLAWDAPVAVRQVELTFPGNLLRSYHAYHPFYRAPETARDYRLLLDGTVILEVTGNYQRRRVHTLDRAIDAREVTIEITATNGDPAAGLYEVRVYS